MVEHRVSPCHTIPEAPSMRQDARSDAKYIRCREIDDHDPSQQRLRHKHRKTRDGNGGCSFRSRRLQYHQPSMIHQCIMRWPKFSFQQSSADTGNYFVPGRARPLFLAELSTNQCVSSIQGHNWKCMKSGSGSK